MLEILSGLGLPREGRDFDSPNDMTPMAWKMPLLIVRSGVVNSPRSAVGVMMPCTTTVMIMMIMLIKASVLAFASYVEVSIRF